ncbi:transposase [Streptomyces sp. C1-2]|nr:transposase [Streptomyces sp. C1-2]
MSDRQVIDEMGYRIRTGISWRDLPERYGPWRTVYTRFRAQADADGGNRTRSAIVGNCRNTSLAGPCDR